MKRLATVVALFSIILSACSSGVSGSAVVASSAGSIGIGEQRVLIAVIDLATGEYLGGPDVGVVATLRDENGSPLSEYPGEFAWIVPDIRGLYSFQMQIPAAETFQITLVSEAFIEAGPVGLVTVTDPLVTGVGDAAPLSVTRTSADYDLAELSSDLNPDPSFYELSADEAIRNGPSVIVFATPAWCTSEACGPLLDQVKALSSAYPDLNYVHVEVYENIQVSSFDELILFPAVNEWGLPAEPWIFVTNDSGTVAASFEGAASDAELAAAFAAVSP